MELSEINVSPAKEKQFNSKGIYTVEDLLRFIPREYYDFSHPISLDDYQEKQMSCIIGTLQHVKIGKGCIIAQVRDEMSYHILKVKWFNNSHMAHVLRDMYDKQIIVCGIITYNEMYTCLEMTSPIIFSDEIDRYQGLYPIYSKINGMAQDYLLTSIETALSIVDKNEKYDEDTLRYFSIPKEYEMYQKVHHPKSIQDIKDAKKRLIFETMYDFAEMLEKDSRGVIMASPYSIKTLSVTNQFLASLPYELTQDQKTTLNSLVETAKQGKHINALIQGDVGCGKTIVAFVMMFAMADNGYQSVLMAPTSVLAEQHYKELSSYGEQFGYKTAFYTGNKMKAAEKRALLKGIADGEYQFIVGTHSLVSQDIQFKELGLTIADEEHKFGVQQREKLKKSDATHSITMSATPIPRSLALTMYGKAMEIHTIETMPNGRLPVRTGIYNNEINNFRFMEMEIEKGRQCYIVCALKNENDNLPVESVEDVAEKARAYFNGKGVTVDTLTGGMDKEATKSVIERFQENKTQILVATTIVEVGVNVPNASTIVIWDADRYGLATLHQLRGRVGRGSYQSYCILKSANKDNPRLVAMCETNSGFEIAKRDLAIRGSGDFIGTQQSGANQHVMLMLQFPKLYKEIEKYVERKIEEEVRLKL